MLVLALLSKKAALHLLPTSVLAIPLFWWARRRTMSLPARLALVGFALILLAAGAVVWVLPSGNAAGWVQDSPGGEPTRSTADAIKGVAALRVAPGAGSQVRQALPPGTAQSHVGQAVVLSGWHRSIGGRSTGSVSVADDGGHSAAELVADQSWARFSVTHTVSTNARLLGVRFRGDGQSRPILYDGLALTDAQGVNLLRNASAEKGESMLLRMVRAATRPIGVPAIARVVEYGLSPTSWTREALHQYWRAAVFAFRSFWGLFGSVTLRLPQEWYPPIAAVCALALGGNVAAAIRESGPRWRSAYFALLAVGCILLALATIAPMVALRGTTWQPQGRYLFPTVFGLAVLTARGWRGWVPSRWDLPATYMVVAALVGFDALTLGRVIIPYYYGS
jgi:hypothetical protein